MSYQVSRVDGRLHYHGKPLPDGPWQGEPDRLEFEHAGMPCLLLRNSSWCGYVGVPPGHPWHGRDYDEVLPYPDVHGGLTYAASCNGLICHVPKPGESDDVWWLGFDCAHSGDLCLYSLVLDRPRGYETYRDIGYVRRETERLAEQVKAVQS